MKKRFAILLILFLFLLGAKSVLADTPAISSISPQNIIKGDAVTIYGSNLAYTNPANSKVCFNDVNTSCESASNAISWTDSEINIIPQSITDFSGVVFVFVDGIKYTGSVYYLKPVISIISLNGNYIQVSGERSYYYNTFLVFSNGQGSIIINGQDLPIEYKNGYIQSLLPDSLKNVGNATIKVKNSYGIESDAKTYLFSTCSADIWTCGDWQTCSSTEQQTRSCNKTFDCLAVDTQSPSTTQSCTYIPPTCTSWTYSDWGSCSADGQQIRTIISSLPMNCTGGVPSLQQACTSPRREPKITSIYPTAAYFGQEVDIIGTGFGNRTVIDGGAGGGTVFIDGQHQGKNLISWTDTKIRIRIIDPSLEKYNSTRLGQAVPLLISIPEQSNSNSVQIKLIGTIPPSCTSDTWSCGDWESCSTYGTQNRICTKTFDCSTAYTPSPITSQRCTSPCSFDTWSCGNWGSCSSSGLQTRSCNKTMDCETANTPSPSTTQSCTYTPPCSADIWTCGQWGACSLSGISSRNCQKTFDCPSAETASPITDQFCEAPNRLQQSAPSASDEILNQDAIVKSTVKLLCPVDAQRASQGSGTVIDSAGTILTNKHVIAGTLGCLVGFIDAFGDEPYFGDRQIADVVKTAPTQDIAILKIRNPKNIKLTYVDITNSNTNLSLGTKVTTYGYPAKFGTKITYTSGDFSGTDGNYYKTTAILEYGNSGGGAYLKNGAFIGIPSAVVKGQLNAMGYILSTNTIKAWLGNYSVTDGSANNNYSRVSVLEDIDLKKLGSLKLFIPDVDKNSNLIAPKSDPNTNKAAVQPQIAKPQDNSVVKDAADQNNSTITDQPKIKKPFAKRFFLWLSNLFGKLATR